MLGAVPIIKPLICCGKKQSVVFMSEKYISLLQSGLYLPFLLGGQWSDASRFSNKEAFKVIKHDKCVSITYNQGLQLRIWQTVAMV